MKLEEETQVNISTKMNLFKHDLKIIFFISLSTHQIIIHTFIFRTIFPFQHRNIQE